LLTLPAVCFTISDVKHGNFYSRRIFLKRGIAAAAAGAALPTILPGGILAAPGRPGPNDKIGIGFIGIGRRASELLANALRLGEARIVGFADVNMKRARENAARHNAFACQDYRKLLERKDVDAIMTATPEHWRVRICVHACQAGKDLYVEKPMSLTVREGRVMVEAVRKYGRVFQTGSQQRSMYLDMAACEFIRSGGLGKIKKVLAYNYPSPWEHNLPAEPVPDELDWEMWCGPAPLVPFNKDIYAPRANPGWLSFRPYSGGEVTGWGSHGYDMIQYALGMDESEPVEFWVEGGPFNPPTYTAPESKARGDKICSEPKVFFKYANGIVVEPGQGPMSGGVFYGEKGWLRVERGRLDSDPEEIFIELKRKRPAGFSEDHVARWLSAIRTRQRPNADVETGHRSASVCHLVNIARWTGRRLKWDPVKEVFPDDAEANKFLDRERRKGYEMPEKV